MMTLTYIFGALVLLGMCIFIHELGHLLGGRMVGIKAKVFSLGYGKGFIKKKVGDTTYQVTLIPFGGYCQFYGEDPGEEKTGEGFEFLSAHPLRRIVTVAMGPLFNLAFGIILFFMMNIIGYSKESNQIIIPQEYTSGSYVSPAYKAGMKTGDRIMSISGKEVRAFSDIQAEVFFSEGETLKFQVDRSGEEHFFDVTPGQASAQEGRFTIGVMPYTKGISVTRVVSGSMADKAGLAENDIIYMVDDTRVYTPADFSGYLQEYAGKNVSVKYYRAGAEESTEIVPVKTEIFVITGTEGREETFAGNVEFRELLDQGLVKIDGKTVTDYTVFLKDAENVQGRNAIFDIRDKRITGSIDIKRKAMIGIEIGLVFDTVNVKMGPGRALVQAFAEPWQFIVMNIKGFGLLFSGKMDVRESISGPIRIAKIAGDVLYYRGASDFILLMAKISIILMIMNLLPIPAVDGSHLVFYTIEAVRGKPINEQIMARIQGFGIIFLITLGIFVIINDISMLPFVQNLFR